MFKNVSSASMMEVMSVVEDMLFLSILEIILLVVFFLFLRIFR